MHLRINDVTVSPARVDELAEVLVNKALPVVAAETGYRGLICSADRATGACAIVSLWDSRASLDASERAISTIRSATVEAVDATLNNVTIAEVLREIKTSDSRVGSRSRVVRLTAPAGQAEALIDFYDNQVAPQIQSQQGFLNGRLIRDDADNTQFAAVSHWSDTAALEASEAVSAPLRAQVSEAIAGALIDRVSTAEVVMIERKA